MGIDPVTLGAVSIGMSALSGAMGIAQGFAQAGVAKQQAGMQQTAAQQTYYMQTNAAQQNERQAAVNDTAQTSTRMAAATRNLGTLSAVMGERGVSGGTFTGLVNDITNSEGVDLGRIGETYQNTVLADQSRIQAQGQDYVNVQRNSQFASSAATSSAWLNTIGTTLKVGGQVGAQQYQQSSSQARFDALLEKTGKGYDVNPYAASY